MSTPTPESTLPEAQAAAGAPPEPHPYTHLTVSFREPLMDAGAGVEGWLTVELDEPVWPEDAGSEGQVPRDNVWDIYKAIDEAFIKADRPSTIHDYESGDVYTIAWLNTEGVIVLAHTYYSDGYAYLSDVEWITGWRLHHG